MIVLFWASLFLLVYAYLGYPLLLWALARLKPRDVRKNKIHPSVSVIVAARNEADKIRSKIENTLGLDYPADRLEIIVASDASDDGTDDIVQAYANQGVRLVRAPHRGGKEFVQGLAVAAAKGDVLVFTDAATMLEPNAIGRLVENFADRSVGAVSTEDLVVDAAGVPTGEGIYVKYEMWVRRLESQFYSLVGLSGSCFAIRKELCSEWSSGLASDFMAALLSARKGYRAVVDPSVRGRFPTVILPGLEIQRRIRTFLRGIRVLMANLDMVNPFAFGRFTFQLVSHKLFRFLAPFPVLTALGTSGLLMAEQPYRVFFWMQMSFYTVGMIGGFVSTLQRNRLVRVASYFTMVQWAMLVAWYKFVRGQHQTTWEPSKRPEIVTSTHGPAR